MSVEITSAVDARAEHGVRPAFDLASPYVALAVAVSYPAFKVIQIARDWLSRRVIGDDYWTHLPHVLVVATLWGACTPLIFVLGRRYPPSKFANVLVHVAALLALMMPIEFYWWSFSVPAAHRPLPAPAGPYLLFRFAQSLLPYALILSAGLLRDRHVERARIARWSLRLQRQLADTELTALRMQVGPALLSRTLEAIEDACRNDPERAERLVVSLADCLRLTLEQIDAGEQRLDRELARLEPFVTLLSVLHGRSVLFDHDIDRNIARRFAAPATLLATFDEEIEQQHASVLRLRLSDDQLVIAADDRVRSIPLTSPPSEPEPIPTATATPGLEMHWPMAMAILLVATAFARVASYLGEAGVKEGFGEVAFWASIGTILTIPGGVAAIWFGRRGTDAKPSLRTLVMLLLFTFTAAYACELAFALVHPRWAELNGAAHMYGFLPTIARSRAVAYNHVFFIVLALFALAARYDEQALDVLALHARVREAQVRKLRSQLRPHFLFNSLNGILGRLWRDADAACAMARSMRRFLQTTFELEPATSVSLDEELDAVREYLEIERNRHGSRMRVEWQIDDDAKRAHVPALLLQPLIENAVQHGVAPVSRPVTIAIRARRDARSLMIEIEDDGAGGDAAQHEGIGIATARGLLDAVNRGESELVAGPRAEGGFGVRIRLPLR